MRDHLELPRLSLAERDRRWELTRAEMKRRGIDCLVLWGWPLMWDFCTANARWLCPIGGNAENNTLVFPLDGEPTSFVFSSTFNEYWKRAQDWVGDVRWRRGTWAETVVNQLKDLKLETGVIGVDGLAGPLDPDGWLPHSVFEAMKAALPAARFENLGDLMETARTVKSAEEIGMLRRAASLGDHMLETCARTAKVGVRESEVYGAMMGAMLAEGGEEPTLFLWACDQYPFPHPFRVPTTRAMNARDLITCEIHPKIGGYFTHVERTFCLGEPDANTRRIYDGCIAAFDAGLAAFAPGKSISQAMNEVKRVIDDRGLGICETGIHGHGLASLEYPRYRFHALKADQAALSMMEDKFLPGMTFAFNINLFDPKWRNGETGAVFADTVLITETGAEPLHRFPREFQVIG
ncbi:Xaa-Pro peptidase family protein [Roseiarcaceae bacterium H3SJ34-1]|uniref:M24 family metallopeptidase n=1 Tax=Terripilifer ovatus TaxID=3032367 RepID=UPI003AB999BF|nr:Xaa-Pro peptidase family protein [Roseiarcaceae bacterium H3SJ34-1]